MDPQKGLMVRAPVGYPKGKADAFVEAHKDWIVKQAARQEAVISGAEALGILSDRELAALKKQASEVLPLRLEAWAKLIGVHYAKVTVRTQKTRWGSCSAKGAINLNSLLMLAPPEVIDSVLVHELCHLKQMNHSERFYQEIYKVMPDYDRRHQWLKKNGPLIMARIPAFQNKG